MKKDILILLLLIIIKSIWAPNIFALNLCDSLNKAKQIDNALYNDAVADALSGEEIEDITRILGSVKTRVESLIGFSYYRPELFEAANSLSSKIITDSRMEYAFRNELLEAVEHFDSVISGIELADSSIKVIADLTNNPNAKMSHLIGTSGVPQKPVMGKSRMTVFESLDFLHQLGEEIGISRAEDLIMQISAHARNGSGIAFLERASYIYYPTSKQSINRGADIYESLMKNASNFKLFGSLDSKIRSKGKDILGEKADIFFKENVNVSNIPGFYNGVGNNSPDLLRNVIESALENSNGVWSISGNIRRVSPYMDGGYELAIKGAIDDSTSLILEFDSYMNPVSLKGVNTNGLFSYTNEYDGLNKVPLIGTTLSGDILSTSYQNASTNFIPNTEPDWMIQGDNIINNVFSNSEAKLIQCPSNEIRIAGLILDTSPDNNQLLSDLTTKTVPLIHPDRLGNNNNKPEDVKEAFSFILHLKILGGQVVVTLELGDPAPDGYGLYKNNSKG